MIDVDGLDMGTRRITLRKDDQCVGCGRTVPARAKVWWNDVTRTVTCSSCTTGPIDVGTAGASAHREYARRVAQHEKRIEASYGTGIIGRFAKVVAKVPQSTTAWERGAEGEVRLSACLRTELGERAIVLDDRRVPRTKSNIDHLVVAPTGVWIIDAKNHTGKIVHRDTGNFLRIDSRLFVDGRDRTALVRGLDGQVGAVRGALASSGLGEIPVRPVLCFTHSEWGLLARPFTVNGVLVTWATALIQRIIDGPPTHDTDPMRLASVLSSALPSAR